MGMFSDLMGKIFRHGADAEAPPDAARGGAPAPRINPGNLGPGGSGANRNAQSQVDVAATLDKLAAGKSEKLDWKNSIVDLMKLVGMDSSLAQRKDLAQDLNYTGDMNDSAAMNVWLHKEVMRKLAENGGTVPADILNH